MSANHVECSRCGKMLMTDSPTRKGSQPVVCAECRERLQLNLSRGAYRPMPTVGGPIAPADSPVEEFVPAWQLAFTEAMPWAMSIAFHLAVLLVLTFATAFIGPTGRVGNIESADGDDPPPGPPREHVTAIGDVDTKAPIIRTGEMDNPQRGEHFGINLANPASVGIGPGLGGGVEGNFADLSIPGPSGRPPIGDPDKDPGWTSLFPPLGDPECTGTSPHIFKVGRAAKSIVFVVDSSGSLNMNFSYVKVELRRTIEHLQYKQQFDIIMFADGPIQEMDLNNNRRGLQRASPINTEAALKWVARRYAKGQTEPAEALRRAMALKPELICFLTDGLIPKETVDELARLNKDHATQINTIGFVSKDGEAVLKEIARTHRGDYRFVSEKDLLRFGEK